MIVLTIDQRVELLYTMIQDISADTRSVTEEKKKEDLKVLLAILDSSSTLTELEEEIVSNLPVYSVEPISGTNKIQFKKGVEIVSEIDLTPYLDDTNLSRLISGTLTNGKLEVLRDDNSTFEIDLSALLGTTLNLTGTNVDLTDPENPIINIKGLQEVTSVDGTTNNKVLIKRGDGSFTGINTDLFIEADNTQKGLTMPIWVENNRTESDPTDKVYGGILRVNNKSSSNVDTVAGITSVARTSGNGNVDTQSSGDFQNEFLGDGSLTGFMSGIRAWVWHLGKGHVHEMRGTYIDVKIDNDQASVTDMLGTHTGVTLNKGTVNGVVDVIFVDLDIVVGNLGSTLHINNDVTYFKGGGGSDVVALKTYLEGIGKKLRYFYNQGIAESDTNGIINYLGTVDNLVNASNKVLVNKEYLEERPLQIKSFTVATLPTGNQEGKIAYVTDGLNPSYRGNITGGGTEKVLVFNNGTNWICH